MCGCGCCGSDDDEKTAAKELLMVPCKYCNTLFPQTATYCPHCGARRTA